MKVAVTSCNIIVSNDRYIDINKMSMKTNWDITALSFHKHGSLGIILLLDCVRRKKKVVCFH